MAKTLEVPEGIGEKMWHTLIKLLAEQEGVKIEYELVRVDETKEETA